MSSSAEGWSSVEIDGHRADVFQPNSATPPVRALLFLRDLDDGLYCGDEAVTAELDRHGLAAVSPLGGHCWWTDKVCSSFDPSVAPLGFLREKLIPWMRERWSLPPGSIGLLGVGMGGQGVLQLAYRYPREFPVVVAVCPEIDFHRLYGQSLGVEAIFPDPESARQRTALLWINPLNRPRHQWLLCDPADTARLEGVERLAMKLSSTGVPFEADFETTAPEPNTASYFRTVAARAIGFIAEKLAEEASAV